MPPMNQKKFDTLRSFDKRMKSGVLKKDFASVKMWELVLENLPDDAKATLNRMMKDEEPDK